MRSSHPAGLPAGRFVLVLVAVQAIVVSAQPPKSEPAAADQVVRSSEPPDTYGGRALGRILAAMNSMDLERLKVFVRDHYAPFWFEGGQTVEALAGGLMRHAKEGGGSFEVVEYISRDPLLIGARVKSARGAHYSFSINVTQEDPARIGMLMIAPTDSGGNRERSAGEAELIERLDRFVGELTAHDQFSGAVLVAKNGKPIYTKAAGLASKSHEAPNRIDTKFNLASMNKMFTAVAVGQLVERGKLSFEDTVGKHLPDYPSSEVREKVAIKHLLSHTSGMGGDIFNKERFDRSPLRYWSIDDVISTFADEPMFFAPGEQMQYCNAGFHVLGKIIEVASGMDYYSYIRENVYKPAGMKDTDSYAHDEVVRNLATGYTRNRLGDAAYFCPECKLSSEGDVWYAGGVAGLRGGPAGGGYSSVEDLNRFIQALLAGKLVDPDTLRLMTTGKVEMPNVPEGRAEYGYGFMIVTTPTSVYFGHGGTYWGVSAELRYYPDLGYTVVVLSNYDLVARVVANRIDRLLPTG